MILDMYDAKDNSSINQLKKSKGIKLIKKYLPHIDANKQVYIVNSVEEWDEIKDRFPDIMTCRTDTKVGTEIPNVHGVTRQKQYISDYMRDVSKIVSNPYFICLELEPGSNERIYTSGGFVLDVNIGQDVRIGYVGPGFDCGELTKGQAEHESWHIPWDRRALRRQDCIERYRVGKITQSGYAETAIKRMAFLIKEYPNRKQEIIDNFSKQYQGISPELFRKLQDEVLLPLWERQEELVADGLQHFGVEMNVVKDNRLVPFEIETPEIFKVKKQDESSRKKKTSFPSIKIDPNDIMTYGKAKGIALLKKYLPGLNPFKTIQIVSTNEQWKKIQNQFSDRLTFRTDTKIGDSRNVRIEGASGKKEEVPEVLEQIKRQNPDAVLLLLETETPQIPRYENDGGFNVGFNLNESVVIELVGKGFDGRELTRDKAVHERYVIPWNEILFMRNKADLMKNRNVEKSMVEPEEYQRTRQERMTFLKSVGCDDRILQESIPENYSQVDSSIIDSILEDVVFAIYKRKGELPKDGLKNFNIQGNIVDGKLVPWEIFRPERLISNIKNIEEK